MNLNSLNYGGIESQTSISESAKSLYLQGQQLAEQKKTQIEEPFDLIGSELLRGGVDSLAKNLVKKTGIKAFANLGKEDLSKTIAKALQESGKKLTNKLTTQGKQQVLNLINKQMQDKGLPAFKLEDLEDTTKLKAALEQKAADANQALSKPPTLEDLRNEVKANTKKVKEVSSKAQKAQGRDTGAGIGKDDEESMKVLGDLQQESKRNVLKKQATKYSFKDENIQNVGKAIEEEDDLPSFSSRTRPSDVGVGTPDSTLIESRDVNPFTTSSESFQPKLKNNIENEASIVDGNDDIENTYASLHRSAINKSIREANPVQQLGERDTTADFLTPKITESQFLENIAKEKATLKAQLPNLPIGQGGSDAQRAAKDADVLNQARERTNRGIAQQALEDKGKNPSDLFTKAENIRDPLPTDTAQLGRTTGTVKAESQLPNIPQPPSADEAAFRQSLADQGKTFESVFTPYKAPPVAPPVSTPPAGTEAGSEGINKGVNDLKKIAPQVEEDSDEVGKGITSALSKLTEGLGTSDLASGGLDLIGDLGEAALGIASLVIPSLIHEGVNKPTAGFSSSIQAGVGNL